MPIPHSDVFNFAADQDFTLEIRLKLASPQTNLRASDNNIVEKWSNDGTPADRTGYPFMLRMLNQAQGANAGKLVAGRYDLTNNPTITSPAAVTDGKFHHVAFAKKASELQLYIDGELAGTATDTATGNTTNQSPLYLARRGGPAWPDNVTGSLYEFRLWNVARSQADIAAAMRTALRGYEDGLVGYWRIQEGEGNVIKDSTANHNDGTVYLPQWGKI